MLVKSLETMEAVVASNKRLSWDGWDVLLRLPDYSGWKKRDGVFIKGKWYVQKRFPITENGWSVPDGLLKKNG